MRKIYMLCSCVALIAFVSCQKQQTEEERKAEIDRQVEQRLAVERQAQEKEQLAQREAELEAREKALSAKQAAAGNTSTPLPRETRDARVVRETSDEEASYNTFYTKLQPYGDWRETSDYGYVWQPRQAESSRDWHPYTEGRWVYTDAGWTWVSEEPFGWATYHYGRWTRLRSVGWVWVPGDEWAPAWVSWRKGADYIGWAPLPPEAHFDRHRGIQNWSDNYYDIGPEQYEFVPTREFGARQVRGTVLPRERNVAIINQTTNITSITYNNSFVVNRGPNYDELRTQTQQPLERLRLERQVNVDLNGQAPRSVVNGAVLTVVAPAIAIGRPVQRPHTVKEKITQPVVDHGWDEISDRSAAEKARTKMKSEAPPPADAPSRTFVKPAVIPQEATPTPSVVSTLPTATATPVFERRATPPPAEAMSASPSPAATTSPVTRMPVRRLTPRPTVKSSSAILPSATPAATAVASPSPEQSARTPEATPSPRQRSTPAALIIPPTPKVSPTPSSEESQEKAPQGQRFKEQIQSRANGANARRQIKPTSSLPSATSAPQAETSPSPEVKEHQHRGEKRIEAGESSSPSPSATPE